MEHNQNAYTQQYEKNLTLGQYTAKTYLLMFAGLLLTFGVACTIALSRAIQTFFFTNIHWMFIGFAVELILVIVLSAAIKKISPGAAYVLFFLYALINGLSMGLILTLYDATFAIMVFALSAVVFGAMGIWGYYTDVDFSKWKNVLFAGLIGLALVGILGIFINLSTLELIISFVGVAFFMAYTAYDTQKIKAYYFQLLGDQAMLQKASIISALELYLDFINIFLYLLRLFSRSRD